MDTLALHIALVEDDETAVFLYAVWNEIQRARKKFPGDNCTLAALVEEVGELSKATFSERAICVYAEAVQVATMAARMATEGDSCFVAWRENNRLDKLPYKTKAAPDQG